MGRCHITREPNPPSSAPLASGDHFVDTASGSTYLSIGTSSVSDWLLVNEQNLFIEANVTASSSADLDVNAMSGFCTNKYVVCVHNVTEDKWASFEMLAGKKTATSVEDTVYSRIGSSLDVDFDFVISGPDAKLVATNNEAFDVNIKVQKRQLP